MSIRNILAPLATTFTGVGGIAFHVAHGPEHILCMGIAAGLAVVGALWGIYNRFSQPRRRVNLASRDRHPESAPEWSSPEDCERKIGHNL